jgi:hypothetical protein
MDISIIVEILKNNPGSYFVVGLVLGYLLRVYISDYRVKRHGRYQSTKADGYEKRTALKSALKEPSFEWADAAANSLAPSKLGGISLDQPGKEV